MATYQTFTSARGTDPDVVSLLALLRVVDATAGVQHKPGTPTYVIKRTADVAWTAPELAALQTAIDTAPPATSSLTAQANIAAWPIELRAFAFALIDQLNVLRAALPTPLGPISPAQVLTAIVNKAKTLPS